MIMQHTKYNKIFAFILVSYRMYFRDFRVPIHTYTQTPGFKSGSQFKSKFCPRFKSAESSNNSWIKSGYIEMISVAIILCLKLTRSPWAVLYHIILRAAPTDHTHSPVSRFTPTRITDIHAWTDFIGGRNAYLVYLNLSHRIKIYVSHRIKLDVSNIN